MANITAGLVKDLRERTGAGMMDCKKALEETDGNFDLAIEYLQKKQLASVGKKAGRIAADGVVMSHLHSEGHIGVIVEINSETDFVARNDGFLAFARDIAEHIATHSPANVDALLAQHFFKDETKLVSQLLAEVTATIGEKISIRRFVRYENENGVVSAYIHQGGRIGVLVELGAASHAASHHADVTGFAKDVAMHVAASNPLVVRAEELDPTLVAKQSEIFQAQAVNEGKPENIAKNIVIGRLKKWKAESCLVDQPFVKDPDKTVSQLVTEIGGKFGEPLTIARFTRFEVGEGIEKKQDDFAAEVAKQIAG